MSNSNFNDRFRQVLLFMIIVAIAVLLIKELTVFMPGFLGAVTLYILSRSFYFKLTDQLKWKKGIVALILILVFIVLIAFPLFIGIQLVSPKIIEIINQQDKLIKGVEVVAQKIKAQTGISILTTENAKAISLKLSEIIPDLLNSTAVLLTNLLMMFFVYYFLLTGGRKMENYILKTIPLKEKNILILTDDTKVMVKANALGIPIICIIQGLFAALGYWIFGIEDWGLWGFFTGLFAFFPLVGTMIIWVPIVVYMYANGLDWPASGLMLYSFIVTGNVDYAARITLMKKIGDVHPIITVLGVIVGLNLFGFIGLVFGPLLVSYFLVLVKIYISEFYEISEQQNVN